jgi:hypothetical protein
MMVGADLLVEAAQVSSRTRGPYAKRLQNGNWERRTAGRIDGKFRRGRICGCERRSGTIGDAKRHFSAYCAASHPLSGHLAGVILVDPGH